MVAVARRSNNFDCLRLIFASLVIVSHATAFVDGDVHRELFHCIFGTTLMGEVAVDGFFLISGFLIVKSWIRNPHLSSFLRKRINRIYPGFIVASCISVFLVGPLAGSSTFLEDLGLGKFLSGLLFLVGPYCPPVFRGTYFANINGSLWTIAYEFRCYLLVAVLGIFGLTHKKWIWLGVALVAIGLSYVPGMTEVKVPDWAHLIVPDVSHSLHFLALFGIGATYCLFEDRIRWDDRVAAGALLLMIGLLFIPALAQIAIAVPGSYLLFWFANRETPSLNWFRNLPDISYGVYLYGWPTEKLLLWYLPNLGPWLLMGFSLLISFGLGYLSWLLVERRFLSGRSRETAPFRTALPDV